MNPRRIALLGTGAAWALGAAGALAVTAPAFDPLPTEWGDTPYLRDPVDLSWSGVTDWSEDSTGRQYRVSVTSPTGEPVPAPRVVTGTSARLPGGTMAEGPTYVANLAASEQPCTDWNAAGTTCTAWVATPDVVAATTGMAFRIDRTAPTLTSIAVNGGDAFTASRTVRVDTRASDATSGVSWLQVSHTGTFACEDEGTCPVPYAASAAVTLPEGPDGPRTVHARVFDAARSTDAEPVYHDPGNASASAADTIFLDREPPTAVASASASAPVAGQSITFGADGSHDDADGADDSGIDPATGYRWDFGDGATATGASTTHAFAAAGARRVRLTVRDRAGNESVAEIALTVGAATSSSGTGSTPTPSTPSGGGTPTTPTPTTGRTPAIASVTAARRWRAGSRIGVRVALNARTTVRMRVLRLVPKRTKPVLALTQALTTGPGTALFRFTAPRTGTYRLTLTAGTTTVTRTVTVTRT